MKIDLKRLMFIIMIIIMLAVTSCTSVKKESPAMKTEQNKSKLFTSPVKLSIMIPSHVSWPYKEDWKVWKYIMDATGTTLNIRVVPTQEWKIKMNLMFTSRDNLPDAIYFFQKKYVNKYSNNGVFISVLDNLDKLPNFKKWIRDYEKSDEKIIKFKTGDNKLHWFPVSGIESTTNIRGWMYRKDIFQRHKIATPKDDEELYLVLKKLKELYPGCYPMINRMGFNVFALIAAQWRTSLRPFYDKESNQWKYGPISENFKEMIKYYKKLYNEQLLPPDFLTMNTEQWAQMVSTSRSFVMVDYLIRKDYFEKPVRKINPDYTWSVMAPPKGGDNGLNILHKTNHTYTGYAAVDTRNEKRISNTLKYIDWFYSDEGMELVSWGKEGETFEVVNEKREFILKNGKQVINLYGIGSYGTYLRVDPKSRENQYTPENVREMHKALEYNMDEELPLLSLAYTEEQQKVFDGMYSSIENYAYEQIARFILGIRPFSEWDDYVEEVKSMDLDLLLKAFEDAYINSKSIDSLP